MDQLDSKILESIQNAFPLCESPYAELARDLEISEEQLWSRIEAMMDEGVVRRVGLSLDSHKFGYSSTLAAISIERERLDEAAAVIGGFDEVTHSYARNDRFNLWFTLIATDQARIESILKEVRVALSLNSSKVLNLPMKRLFKLNARFNKPC